MTAAYREASEYLDSLRSRLPCDKVFVFLVPASDGGARQIVEYAADNGVDLIVISSHGRSGVSRWVHGSVAEKVLSGAPCAVLVVRTRGHSQRALYKSGLLVFEC